MLSQLSRFPFTSLAACEEIGMHTRRSVGRYLMVSILSSGDRLSCPPSIWRSGDFLQRRLHRTRPVRPWHGHYVGRLNLAREVFIDREQAIGPELAKDFA